MFWLKRNNIFWILFITLAAIPALFGVFHSGFFVSDDGNWMVIRFSAFYQAFTDGQIPTRFLSRLNNNYGYPVSNFLYPGFLYAGVPLRIVGLNSLEVVKVLYALGILGGSLFAFMWLKTFFSQIAALTGAVIFTYVPYHLYTLYSRGSLGELLAMAILLLCFWSLEKRKRTVLSLGIFALLLSHNTLAVIFIFLFLLYAIIRRMFGWGYLSFIVGGLMSSFFTIPALYDLQYTKFSLVKISNPLDHFATFPLAGWGSFVIAFCVIVVITLVFLKKRENQHRWVAVAFLSIFAVSIILATEVSSLLWQVIPSSWIQFPFRFLSVAAIASAFLSGYVVHHLFPKYRYVVGFGLIIIVVFFSQGHLFPKKYEYQEVGYYDTNESLTTTHDEYMPNTVKSTPQVRAGEKIEVVEGEAGVINPEISSREIKFTLNAKSDSLIRINTVFFPGWSVKIDGEREIQPLLQDDGLMYVPFQAGTHTVSVRFSETPLRLLADAFSIIGVLILILPMIIRTANKLLKQ